MGMGSYYLVGIEFQFSQDEKDELEGGVNAQHYECI
jgi:hypothetical protein